jgi:hypothetical protein
MAKASKASARQNKGTEPVGGRLSGTRRRAIKNDITNWQMATPRGVQDITGVDKSANERLLLLADAPSR